MSQKETYQYADHYIQEPAAVSGIGNNAQDGAVNTRGYSKRGIYNLYRLGPSRGGAKPGQPYKRGQEAYAQPNAQVPADISHHNTFGGHYIVLRCWQCLQRRCRS